MDIYEQKTAILEKKKNKYSKSYRNRNRFPKERYYIQGNEIITLSSLIQSKFETDLSGFAFDFLHSIEKKISNMSGDKLFLSDKQKNVLYGLLLDEDTEDKKLGFFFKKSDDMINSIDKKRISKSEILKKFQNSLSKTSKT